jgi:hypothetical protein
MAKLLGIQKKIVLLVISFLLSCVYRTFAGRGEFEIRGQTLRVPAHSASESLAFWFDAKSSSNTRAAQRYIVELSKFFPFVRLNFISREGLPVSIASIPYLSELAVPELRDLKIRRTSGLEASSPSCSPSPPPPICPVLSPLCPGDPGGGL